MSPRKRTGSSRSDPTGGPDHEPAKAADTDPGRETAEAAPAQIETPEADEVKPDEVEPTKVEPDEVEPDEIEPADSGPSARRPASRASIVIGVLVLVLGFALAVQVKQYSAGDDLTGARQEDLVRILDDLDAREQRLREEIAVLQNTKQDLTTGGNQAKAAQNEAQKRSEQLSILAGTVAAKGPGIILTITDPQSEVTPEVILDAIQELRAAGAEAIQVNDVRVGLSTALTGSAGAVSIDAVELTAPYSIRAIGSAETMNAAMNIPGGVAATVRLVGGQVRIQSSTEVLITALREPDKPDYAQPATPTK